MMKKKYESCFLNQIFADDLYVVSNNTIIYSHNTPFLKYTNILLNKAKFIQKFSEDPNYIPRESQTMYSRQDIPRNKAILLQKLILKINIQDYLRDVKFPNNLGYLGVAVHMIGEDLERENKKLTKFLISEFTRLYSNQTNTIRRLDEIYYNGDILNYSKLEIFEEMINNNNIERLRI